jgi:hypothetical protein
MFPLTLRDLALDLSAARIPADMAVKPSVEAAVQSATVMSVLRANTRSG